MIFSDHLLIISEKDYWRLAQETRYEINHVDNIKVYGPYADKDRPGYLIVNIYFEDRFDMLVFKLKHNV